MPALCVSSWGQKREEEGGQGPSAPAAAGALSVSPAATPAHLRVNSPSFHTAHSCLSLPAPGTRGAKNNQAGTATCGTLTVVASGQAGMLSASLMALPLPSPATQPPLVVLVGVKLLPHCVPADRAEPSGGLCCVCSAPCTTALGCESLSPIPCVLLSPALWSGLPAFLSHSCCP